MLPPDLITEVVMVRKAVIVFSILALLNFTTGCATSSTMMVSREGIPALEADTVSSSPIKIHEANLADGTVLVFNRDGGRYRDSFRGQDSVLIGITGEGELVVTPLRDVESVKVTGTEPVKREPTPMTFLEWTGIVVGVAALVAAFLLLSGWDPPTSFEPD